MRRRTAVLSVSSAAVVLVAGAVVAGLLTGGSSPEAAGGLDAPAFVDGSTGAPVVQRGDDPAPSPDERQAVDATPLGSAASFPDGLRVEADQVERGVVTSTGSGVVTGASYVVFSVEVHNGTDASVDLSAVVPTLRHGDDAVASAPLYDDVEVADLSGMLEPGADATARYAFVVPEGDVDGAQLFLDLDAAHAPAVFEGTLAR